MKHSCEIAQSFLGVVLTFAQINQEWLSHHLTGQHIFLEINFHAGKSIGDVQLFGHLEEFLSDALVNTRTSVPLDLILAGCARIIHYMVFIVPGNLPLRCTLHEAQGMKRVIVVPALPMFASD